MNAEYQNLREQSLNVGAIVTFSGLVREFDNGNGEALYLEYYPAMTEKSLKEIINQARERWHFFNARIVHRVGKLALGEQIVFVGVNSAHREDAFNACQFIMDFLKTQAPFWKKAITKNPDEKNSEYWIEAKTSDNDAANRWNNDE